MNQNKIEQQASKIAKCSVCSGFASGFHYNADYN